MQINGHDFVFGSDPEYFLWNTKHLRYEPAYMYDVPGTKTQPVDMGEGFFVQKDGLALEFNTPVYNNISSLLQGIQEGKRRAQLLLPKYIELHGRDTVFFDPRLLYKAPQEDLELGCDPDFNAYTEQANVIPKFENLNMRTGSGHIHIGWRKTGDKNDPDHIEACVTLSKCLDAVILPYSLTSVGSWCRTVLYGKPGSFRPKTYGVEYRTLGASLLNKQITNRDYLSLNHLFSRAIGNAFNHYDVYSKHPLSGNVYLSAPKYLYREYSGPEFQHCSNDFKKVLRKHQEDYYQTHYLGRRPAA